MKLRQTRRLGQVYACPVSPLVTCSSDHAFIFEFRRQLSNALIFGRSRYSCYFSASQDIGLVHLWIKIQDLSHLVLMALIWTIIPW